MPQFHPKNVSSVDGYSAYLDELEFRNHDEFIRQVLSALSKGDTSFLVYLDRVKTMSPASIAYYVFKHLNPQHYKRFMDDVKLMVPDTYIEFQIEHYYAMQKINLEREQAELRAQLIIDEEKAFIKHFLQHMEEQCYEKRLVVETSMEIYEFFGPDYDDGLFPAETAAELDLILATELYYAPPRKRISKRRKQAYYRKRRLGKIARIAQANFERRLDNDLRQTGNCAGIIVNHPNFATIKSKKIWKRAKKAGLVEGDMSPSNSGWKLHLSSSRRYI